MFIGPVALRFAGKRAAPRLSLRPRGRTGRRALASLVVLLVLSSVGNIGGAPPSVPIPAVTAIVGFSLLLALSWWADRHRERRATRSGDPAPAT